MLFSFKADEAFLRRGIFMKKQLFFAITVFALAGLLFLTGCPEPGNGGGGGVSVSKTALGDKIAEAQTELLKTEVATAASQVSSGLFWVTEQSVIDALETAIASAQSVFNSSGSSQSAVDAAVTALNEALNAFNAARQPGTGARKNSVTITGFPTSDYPNGSGIFVGLFATAAISFDPEIYGSGEIQNGAVRVDLYTSSGGNDIPWVENGLKFVGFMVQTGEFSRAFVSKASVNFTVENPNPSITFSNFNQYIFQQIGELTGKITLTGISNPPPKVFISANGYRNSFYSSDSEITGITGTSGTFDWSIPVYENDGFEAGETEFRLWVQTGSSKDDGFNIYIPGDKTVSTPDDDVGSLGTVSIAFVTLSGTINVSNNGNPVPFVEINVYGESSGWIRDIRLTSPASGASWSMAIPALDPPEEIYFSINGYTSNKDFLFGDYYYPDPSITVSTSDKSGISLSLAYLSVTLSGTLNATYVGNRVPHVTIYAYSEDDDWLGYTDFTSPASDAPWSITIPVFDSPTGVYFNIKGYSSDWDQLFSRNIQPDSTTTVSNQDISGISLTVAVQTITLSGTLNHSNTGTPVPRVKIDIVGENGGLGSTELTSPASGASWSIVIPELDPPEEIYFYITGHTSEGDQLFIQSYYPSSSITVSDKNVPNISLSFDYRTIILSGTITATFGGTVPRVQIEVFGDDSGLLGSVEIESPGSNAPWSMDIQPLDSEENIYFYISGYSSDRDYLFGDYYYPNPEIPVFDQNVPNIPLSMVIQTITLSGTINVTFGGKPVPVVRIESNPRGVTSLTSPGSNAPWSITIAAPDSPTEVDFYIVGNSKYGEYLFDESYYPSPSITVSTSNSSGIVINLGDITDPSPLEPVSVTSLTTQWANGNLNDGELDWYSFTATAGQTYYIWWNDKFGGDGTKTSDVKVIAYDSDGDRIFSQDSGWDSPGVVSGASGTVYIRVSPDWGAGTYAITYSIGEGSDRP
jgi:hypothetical protein